MISNLTPVGMTEGLVAAVSEAAAKAERPSPAVVQYAPCAARDKGDEARRLVRPAIAEALTLMWPNGDAWPRRRETAVAESGIPRAEFAAALDRLRRGDAADAVLDDRFVAAFAIAGTPAECLAQAARYGAAGVDELALTFAGEQPEDDIASLGRALAAV